MAFLESGPDAALGRDRRRRSWTQPSVHELEDGRRGEEREEEREGTATLAETTANLLKTLIGAGVLGMPYIFGQAGWSCCVIALTVCAISGWTAWLLARLMEECRSHAKAMSIPKQAFDWPFLGFVAFGEVGRSLCSVVFVTELIFAMLSFLVVNGVHLNILVPSIDRQTCIAISGFLGFVSLAARSSAMASLSIFGLLAAATGVLSLAWSSAVMPEWTDRSRREWLHVGGLPVAVGILQFSFVCHGMIPTLIRNMREPDKFTHAILMAFPAAALFYTSVGMGAYYIYGSQAHPSFMENLGRDLNLCELPGMSFLYIAATSCFFVNLQTTFPLLAIALIEASEAYVGIVNKGSAVKWMWKLLIMLGTVAIAAVFRDCMASVKAITGSLCCSCTALIMPIAFSWKVRGAGPCMKFANCCCLLYGVGVIIFGTYDSMQDALQIIEDSAVRAPGLEGLARSCAGPSNHSGQLLEASASEEITKPRQVVVSLVAPWHTKAGRKPPQLMAAMLQAAGGSVGRTKAAEARRLRPPDS